MFGSAARASGASWRGMQVYLRKASLDALSHGVIRKIGVSSFALRNPGRMSYLAQQLTRRMVMRKIAVSLLLLSAVLLAAQTSSKKSSTAAEKAPAAPAKHVSSADDVAYGPPPPLLPPGSQVAVLEGDPARTSGDE